MKPTDPLLPAWFDRPLNAAEVGTLSRRLADDPALADRMAELAAIDAALAEMADRRTGGGRDRGVRWLRPALAGMAAACILFGLLPFLRPSPAPLPEPAAPARITRLGTPAFHGPPPVFRSAAERAAAAWDRRLSQQPVGRNARNGTTLRELTGEWRTRWTGDPAGPLEVDLAGIGDAADLRLTFVKPGGSLRGLLSHAAALAGCRLKAQEKGVCFEPLSESTTARGRHLFAADAAPDSPFRAFVSTGTIPPAWGLPTADFQTEVLPDAVAVVSSRWNLARLEAVLDSSTNPFRFSSLKPAFTTSRATSTWRVWGRAALAGTSRAIGLPPSSRRHSGRIFPQNWQKPLALPSVTRPSGAAGRHAPFPRPAR